MNGALDKNKNIQLASKATLIFSITELKNTQAKEKNVEIIFKKKSVWHLRPICQFDLGSQLIANLKKQAIFQQLTSFRLLKSAVSVTSLYVKYRFAT